MTDARSELRLAALHAAWVSADRPAQSAVAWSRSAWCRSIPQFADFFKAIPDRIDRTFVAKRFLPEHATEDIIETFLLAMMWGHGSTGYGAWRTRQILANSADVGTRLLDVYKTAREAPLEAYRSMGYHHRNRLVGLGPAFGTKFISYAAGSDGVHAPILDALTAAWVARFTGESFASAVWRPTEYARYLALLSEWAAALGEDIGVTEFLMFADASKNLSRNRRRSSQWAEPWVPDLEGA